MGAVSELSRCRGRRGVVGTATVALVTGLGVFVLAPPAHAVAPRHAPPPRPSAPSGLLGEDAAMRQAVATGRPVEVSALTTETIRVMADPAAGGFVAEVSAGPVRVMDKTTGGWRPVDPTIVLRPDGTVGPVAAALRMAFSAGGAEPLARISDGEHEVDLGWPGQLPEPVLSGATATYPDVLADVNLVVEAGVLGFRELLVVRSPRGAAQPALRSLRFSLAGRGVTAADGADGGLRIADASGRPVFVGAPPRMWDSSGRPAEAPGPRHEERDGARAAAIDLTVTGSSLTLRPNLRLLDDPSLVFPLIIDPAISRTHERTYWTMVWSNGLKFPNDSTEHARVGYDGWSSAPKKARSFFRFDTTVFAGKHIFSAVFAHKQIHSPNHDCGLSSFGPGVQVYRTGSISSSTSWTSQPSWAQLLDTDGLVHGHEDYCAGYDRQEWNVEAGVEVVASAKSATLTLGMKSADETDRDGWRKYDNDSSYPLITVRYSSVPNTPSNVKIADPATSCVTSSTSPAIINDATPKFQATLTDPDGASAELRGRFELYDGSTLVWSLVTSAEVVSGTTVTATTTALTNGKTYRWRVRAEEYIEESTDVSGWYPSSTGYCYVEIDTSKPPAPTVTSTTYPELDPDNVVAYGGVGQSGNFTLTAGATDVAAYYYQLNDGPVQSRATSGGAAVTVSVVPDQFGPNVLHVYTRDAASN